MTLVTPDELRTIRERNEELRREEADNCVFHDKSHEFCGGIGSDCDAHDCYADQIADIDVLLAEVERLNAILEERNNEIKLWREIQRRSAHVDRS